MLSHVVSHYRAALNRRTTAAYTMIIDPHVHAWIASSTAWLPLLYSTAVVSLTLYRTAGALYSAPSSTVEFFRVMLREGLLNYSAICTVTLAFTIAVVSAVPSVRGATAQLELCLTVAMMSHSAPGVLVISSYATHQHRSHGLPPRSPAARTWNDCAGDIHASGTTAVHFRPRAIRHGLRGQIFCAGAVLIGRVRTHHARARRLGPGLPSRTVPRRRYPSTWAGSKRRAQWGTEGSQEAAATRRLVGRGCVRSGGQRSDGQSRLLLV
ncbi:hypothetical protein EDB92DRAFT_1466231 [Lactarius akahatsu]|uniref:Uncharacterized protein n=1 Tax=Lactarius akahatsu TaxID=416441 RepID=A0AAD4Q4Z9_9AGAM|nr:hypothetical protein EDB92DRAFT_1466231 [Lactarius akahatsu]